MNYTARMDVFEGEAYLDEPIKYLRLTEKLLVLYFTLNVVAQIADFAILHDDY